jgi:hypothetical protein
MLSDGVASNDFGVQLPSAGSSPASSITHTFQSLDFEGIAMSNVPVVVYYDQALRAIKDSPGTGTRLTDTTDYSGLEPLTLGMHELRNLHIFLSFGEGKMYITPASAPAPAPSGK